MIMKFEASELQGGTFLGAGDHNCRITKIEKKPSKKGGENLEIEFTSAAELTARDWFPTAGAGRFKIGRLALACGFTEAELTGGRWDTAQLANRYVRIVREVTGEEAYTDKDGKEKVRKNFQNNFLPSPNQKPSSVAGGDAEIPF